MSGHSALPLVAVVAYIAWRAVLTSHTGGEKAGALLSIAVGIAPAVWVLAAGRAAPRLVVGYAVLFFAASVLLKWALYRTVLSKRIQPRLGAGAGAVAQGILSAGCELGAAAVAFGLVFPALTAWEVFGFGAGAAAVEALMVTLLENPHAGTEFGERVAVELGRLRKGPQWMAALVPFVERAIATTDHTACRGLVAAALASGLAWPAVLAFAVFAVSDGYAHYCLKRGWEFGRPAIAARFYGVLAIPAAGSAAAWAALL